MYNTKGCNYILSDTNTPPDFIESIKQSTNADWTVLEKLTPNKMPKWRRKLITYNLPFASCYVIVTRSMSWRGNRCSVFCQLFSTDIFSIVKNCA